MSEAVVHPNWYKGSRQFEVIDVIHDWKLGFNRGNAIKYIARAGHKEPAREIEDLQKAIFYLQDEIKRITPKPDTKEKRK